MPPRTPRCVRADRYSRTSRAHALRPGGGRVQGGGHVHHRVLVPAQWRHVRRPGIAAQPFCVVSSAQTRTAVCCVCTRSAGQDQARAADGLVLCYVCMRPNPRLSDDARASIGCVMWVGSVVRVVTPLQCLARVAVHKWGGAGGARALSYAERVRAPKSHGARVLYGRLHECTSVNAPPRMPVRPRATENSKKW